MPFRRTAIAEFAEAHLLRPLTVVSVGLDCFRVNTEHGVHKRIVSGGGKASTQSPEFKCLNTALGNFKTAIAGTYHAFRFAKYAPRYLAEVQHRFNRRYHLDQMLRRMLRALLAAPPGVAYPSSGGLLPIRNPHAMLNQPFVRAYFGERDR